MKIELEVADRRRRRRRRRGSMRGLALPLSTPRRAASSRLRITPVVLVVVLAAAYIAFSLVRSLPAVRVATRVSSLTFPGVPPDVAWPKQGESAVAIEGIGTIGTHGAATPTPIASVAKVMTAYVVLADHPLRGNAAGPTLTINQADVSAYRADAAAGQSVVAVRVGERITERQALEGLLLPSGNNMATLLAGWDAGSQAAFVARMNQDARALGLSRTHYTGASGVQASTVSTAADQLRLATVALRDPVFRQIVAMPQTTLPVAGRQYNVDALLGRDGIVGIKTGTTTRAGGCFVFAARQRDAGRTLTVVGAVLHQTPTSAQPSIISAAFSATKGLLASVPRAVSRRRIVKSGTTLGYLDVPWSKAVALKARRSVSLDGWRGLRVHLRVRVDPAQLPSHVQAGQPVGDALLTAGAQRVSVPLVASAALSKASLGWRLEHP